MIGPVSIWNRNGLLSTFIVLTGYSSTARAPDASSTNSVLETSGLFSRVASTTAWLSSNSMKRSKRGTSSLTSSHLPPWSPDSSRTRPPVVSRPRSPR